MPNKEKLTGAVEFVAVVVVFEQLVALVGTQAVQDLLGPHCLDRALNGHQLVVRALETATNSRYDNNDSNKRMIRLLALQTGREGDHIEYWRHIYNQRLPVRID